MMDPSYTQANYMYLRKNNIFTSDDWSLLSPNSNGNWSFYDFANIISYKSSM